MQTTYSENIVEVLLIYGTFITDCVAPYSVDIQFDNVGDPLTTMQNTLSSCGKIL